MRSGGGVELDRAVDSIQVGYRFRGDLGDLDELCTSIQTVGLLQPITITPDGTLVCGARRLAAVRKLGWDRIKVWVNSAISSRLAEVLAEQHENTTRKPLTPTEATALYAELKQLYAADAARRQHATRFSSEHNPRHHGGNDGGADSAPPSDQPPPDPTGSDLSGVGVAGIGKARRQAARAITGRSSYWSLEHVADVQRIAEDRGAPEALRNLARRELAAMDADGTIHPHYLTVQAAASTTALARLADDVAQPATVRDHAARELSVLDHGQPPAELVKAAQAAIARATGTTSDRPDDREEESSAARPVPIKRYGLRAFLATIEDMDGWWQHYDAVEIGAGLSETQWLRVRANLDASLAFIDAIAAAREHATGAERGDRTDGSPEAACF
ncbi:ParB N-terminal domain-containing protein [Calidifontibacter sp. DB0510]|uniref:ParB N-terminal domain-containing protein n=1 Tax=Metallococcus carri TaxID=1656884 RepID=A0A967E911_9MICO|nr:ParB N-terminal domain-containing protein [Metallococcus carri]NHN55847.1 ParB N-terminal domain-containing protein [Metallococcus carri]NOP38465.1 ParB N-terminal domain-containing protein [Calidifontibacter sp. DB2511S]